MSATDLNRFDVVRRSLTAPQQPPEARALGAITPFRDDLNRFESVRQNISFPEEEKPMIAPRGPIDETLSALGAGFASTGEAIGGTMEMLGVPGGKKIREEWSAIGKLPSLQRPTYLQQDDSIRGSDWRWWVRNLGENIPNFVMMYGVGGGVGTAAKAAGWGLKAISRASLAGGFGGSFTLEAGSQYSQAKTEMLEANYDPAKIEAVATMEGLISGTANAIIEMLPMGNVFGRQPIAKRMLKRILQQGVLEGGTEIMQEGVNVWSEKMGHKPDQQWSDQINRMLTAGIVGGVMGGAVGGPSGASVHKNQVKQYNALADQIGVKDAVFALKDAGISDQEIASQLDTRINEIRTKLAETPPGADAITGGTEVKDIAQKLTIPEVDAKEMVSYLLYGEGKYTPEPGKVAQATIRAKKGVLGMFGMKETVPTAEQPSGQDAGGIDETADVTPDVEITTDPGAGALASGPTAGKDVALAESLTKAIDQKKKAEIRKKAENLFDNVIGGLTAEDQQRLEETRQQELLLKEQEDQQAAAEKETQAQSAITQAAAENVAIVKDVAGEHPQKQALVAEVMGLSDRVLLSTIQKELGINVQPAGQDRYEIVTAAGAQPVTIQSLRKLLAEKYVADFDAAQIAQVEAEKKRQADFDTARRRNEETRIRKENENAAWALSNARETLRMRRVLSQQQHALLLAAREQLTPQEIALLDAGPQIAVAAPPASLQSLGVRGKSTAVVPDQETAKAREDAQAPERTGEQPSTRTARVEAQDDFSGEVVQSPSKQPADEEKVRGIVLDALASQLAATGPTGWVENEEGGRRIAAGDWISSTVKIFRNQSTTPIRDENGQPVTLNLSKAYIANVIDKARTGKPLTEQQQAVHDVILSEAKDEEAYAWQMVSAEADAMEAGFNPDEFAEEGAVGEEANKPVEETAAKVKEIPDAEAVKQAEEATPAPIAEKTAAETKEETAPAEIVQPGANLKAVKETPVVPQPLGIQEVKNEPEQAKQAKVPEHRRIIDKGEFSPSAISASKVLTDKPQTIAEIAAQAGISEKAAGLGLGELAHLGVARWYLATNRYEKGDARIDYGREEEAASVAKTGPKTGDVLSSDEFDVLAGDVLDEMGNPAEKMAETEPPQKPAASQGVITTVGKPVKVEESLPDLTVTGQQKPVPGHPEAGYVVHHRKPDLLGDTFKVVLSRQTPYVSIMGTGMDAAAAYRNALVQYEHKLAQEAKNKPAESKPVAEKKVEGTAFQQGERVVLKSGRHGIITKVDTVTMQAIGLYGGGRSESRSHYYQVKSDSGAEFHTSEADITREEGKAPTAVPDIVVEGKALEPDHVLRIVDNSRQQARSSEAATQRARKPENIRDAKTRTEDARKRAAFHQAAFDEWAAKYPEEAKKYLPEKAAPSQGVAIATGQKTAATTTPGAVKGPETGPRNNLADLVGLVITKGTTNTGKTVWNVSGNTREHSETIKKAGGRWYGPKKVWSFYNGDPTVELQEALGIKPEVAQTAARGVRFAKGDKVIVQHGNATYPATVNYSGTSATSVTPDITAKQAADMRLGPAMYVANELIKPAASLGKAASEVAAGVASSYDAIAEIMKRAGKGPISMMGGGVFDEELYKAIKPHLQATYDHFRAATIEVKEWMKETISQFNARGFEPQAILPYIKRFYMEATKNDLTKDETAAILNSTEGGVGHEEGIPRGESASRTLAAVAGTPGLDAGKLSGQGEGTLPGGKAESVPGQKSSARLEDDLQPERQGEEYSRGPGSGQPRHPVAAGRPGVSGQAAGAASGETGSRNNEVGGEPARRSRPSDRGLGVNTRIEPSDVLFHSGKVARINANIRAIELSKQLVSENRAATPAEQKILLQFSGWGAVAQDIFNPQYDDYVRNFHGKMIVSRGYYGKTTERAYQPSDKIHGDALEAYQAWKEKYGDKLHPALGGILTEEEWKTAEASTMNAHYTSREVIDHGLWGIARRLGFEGGRAGDPAAGIGHILGLMPADYAGRVQLFGVELDKMTGQILSQLYPKADIQVTGFEKAQGFPDNSVDLVISNFPFGNYPITDNAHPAYSGWSIHNYFFARSVDALRPGGVVIAITSRYTMDSTKNGKTREYLADKADLVGAIRLPNNAFGKSAGTEVTSDIIILRKKTAEAYPERLSWRTNATVKINDATNASINEYFAQHPDMVLGNHSMSGSMYGGKEEYTLAPDTTRLLTDQIDEAVARLPQGIYNTDNAGIMQEIQRAEAGTKPGTFVLKDGKISYVNHSGVMVPPEWAAERKKVIQAAAFTYVRDKAGELIRTMQDPDADATDIAELQRKLNQEYDLYRQKYGPFNEKGSLFLAEDVEFPLVLALENVVKRPVNYVIREGKNKGETRTRNQATYVKADIFTKRTLFPFVEPVTAENIEDAVNLSLTYKNHVSPDYIAQLLGKDKTAVQSDLVEKELAFLNPANGLLESRSEYLSGNVREKLRIAEAQGMEKNAEALRAVQPRDLTIDEIYFRLGSEWIPAGVIDGFMQEKMETGGTATLAKVKAGEDEVSRWTVEDNARWNMNSPNHTVWGAEGRSGTQLVEDCLNLHRTEIYDYVTDANGKETRVKNPAKSLNAQQKQREIQAAFKEYVKEHAAHAPAVAAVYNQEKNNYVVRQYDVPGIDHYPHASHLIKLRAHQKGGVSRGLQGSTIFAHAVGTGKTYMYATLAMELRRTGQAHKPLIVVQGSTVNQFSGQAKQLYPAARILCPSKKDRTKSERRALLARIATNDYDMIIIPHSFFDDLNVNPEREKAFIEEQLEEIKAAILDLGRDVDKPKRNDTPTVKQLHAMLARKEARLEVLTHSAHGIDTIYFDEMGIDAVLVDEAHHYKRGDFSTKMGNVKGLDRGAAAKSFRFLMKTRAIQEKTGGKNIYLATGTPVSNTTAELWTLLRYVRPDLLAEFGAGHFDGFASMFGDMTRTLEQTETGEFKDVERFNRYVNGPELIKMWQTAADVILQEDVPGWADMIPKLKGEGIQSVAIPRSQDLADEIERIRQERAEWDELTGQEKKELSHVPLLLFNRAKQAAIDLRLVRADAADNPDSKTNRVVKEVFNRWQESREILGTQLVFADTYRGPNGFSLYNDIKKKLIGMGIPEAEIANITDNKYNNDAAKENLFDRVNQGAVRVVIGSTAKLGIGVNVQERLVALHHVDAPMRPMDFEQRNGRILRPGNTNQEVEVLAYAVINTLDSVTYDRLQKKQKFINQLLRGKLEGRSFEDPADELQFTFEDLMAASAGNPLVKKRFELENNIREIAILEDGYRRKIGQLRTQINRAEGQLDRDKKGLKEAEKEKTHVEAIYPDNQYRIEVAGTTHEDVKEGKKALQAEIGKAEEKVEKAYVQMIADLQKREANPTNEDRLARSLRKDKDWTIPDGWTQMIQGIKETVQARINGKELAISVTAESTAKHSFTDPVKQVQQLKEHRFYYSYQLDPRKRTWTDAFDKEQTTTDTTASQNWLHGGLEGILTSMRHILKGISERPAEIASSIEKQEKNLASMKAEIKKPFEFTDTLIGLRQQYNQVLVELGATKATPVGDEAAGATEQGVAIYEPVPVYTVTENGLTRSPRRAYNENQEGLFNGEVSQTTAVRSDNGKADVALLPGRQVPDAGRNVLPYTPQTGILPEVKSEPIGTWRSSRSEIKTAGDAAVIARDNLDREPQEVIISIVTDKDGKILAINQHSIGGPGQAQFFPNILTGQILNVPGASKAWLIHNHPSGNPQLSSEDIDMRRRVGDLLEESGVNVMPVLAVTPRAYSESDGGMFAPAIVNLPEKKDATHAFNALGRKYDTIPGNLTAITGEQDIIRFGRTYLPDGGMILVSGQNEPVAIIKISDYSKLRPNHHDILREAEKRNASGFMIYDAKKILSDQDLGNLDAFKKKTGLEFITVYDKKGDHHEKIQNIREGKNIFTAPSTFYALADRKTLDKQSIADLVRGLAQTVKGLTVEESGSQFSIRTKAGQVVQIQGVNRIDADTVSLTIGYSEKARTGREVVGEFRSAETPGKTAEIRLVRGKAGAWTINHEFYHFLEDIGAISNEDKNLLNRKIRALVLNDAAAYAKLKELSPAEQRAEWTGRTLAGMYDATTPTGKIIQKIKDVIDQVLNALGIRTAGGVVRDIRSGKIQERRGIPGTMRTGMAQYALADEVEKVIENKVARPVSNIVNRGLALMGARTSPAVREATGAFAKHWKEFWQPFSTVPDGDKILAKRYEAMGNVARAVRFIDDLFQKVNSYPDQIKKDLFWFLNGDIPIETLPAEVRETAQMIRRRTEVIGEMLVERGIIAEGQFEKYRGKYIHYMYAKHVLGEDSPIFLTSSGKLNLSYTKSRNTKLTMQQKKELGLIEDASVAVPVGMGKALTDIAKWDYLKSIADNADWVWQPSLIKVPVGKALTNPVRGRTRRNVTMGIGKLVEEVKTYDAMLAKHPTPEVAEIHKILHEALDKAEAASENMPADFVQLPNSKGYGPLAGAFIRKAIADDLMPVLDVATDRGKLMNTILEIERQGMAGFKMGKVALNFPTAVRNIVSNIIQNNMRGRSLAQIPGDIIRACESIKAKDAYYEEAYGMGIFHTNWFVSEINDVLDEFRKVKAGRIDQILIAVKNVAKYYGKIDDINKLAIFIEQREAGNPVDEATLEAMKWGMDYSLTSRSIKGLRQTIMPFATYQYKIAPLILESLKKRPWVLAKFGLIYTAAKMLAMGFNDLDDDDWTDLEKQLPAYIKKSGSMMILPWKSNKGQWQWVNLEYFFPWGNYLAIARDMKTADLGEAIRDAGLSNPFLSMFYTGLSAREDQPPLHSYFGTPIYNQLDPAPMKAAKLLEYMANIWIPSMATRQGAIGYTGRAIAGGEDRWGREVSAGQALGRWFGVNIVSVSPEQTRAQASVRIQDLRKEQSRIEANPSYDEEEKKAYAKRLNEKLAEIAQEAPAAVLPITKAKGHDAVYEALQAMAAKGILHTAPPSRSVEIAGTPFKMTMDQYSRYLEQTSDIARKRLLSLVESPAWEQMSDKRKSDAVSGIVANARKGIRQRIKVEIARDNQEKIREAKMAR